MLRGESDETIDHIISERNKLAQNEYKTRHSCIGKVVHQELCKILKLDLTAKWYMHKPESVPRNETHNILWIFEIQMDHLTSARRQSLVLINKKKQTCYIVDFVVSAYYWVKIKESVKIGKYLDLAREQNKNCRTRRGR